MGINLQMEFSPIYFEDKNEYRALLNTIKPYAEYINIVVISDVKNEFFSYLKKNMNLLKEEYSSKWGEEDQGDNIYKNHIFSIDRTLFDKMYEFEGFFKREEDDGKEKISTTGFGLSNVMFYDDRGFPLFYTILTETKGKIRSDLYPLFQKNLMLL